MNLSSNTIRFLKVPTLCLFLLTACEKEKPKSELQSFEPTKFYRADIAPNSNPEIKVINQFGEPIAKAKVLIGSAQGAPFKGNFLETDKSGVVVVSKEWAKAEHVTIDATGYIRQTLLNQNPGQLIIKLNTAYLTQKAELKGQVTQLPVENGDKLIDFGLVVPALSKLDLIQFDLDQVISPYTDVLSVAGQSAPLPSNVSLPTQKENYIFNLTISKPTYRLYTPTLGQKRLYAARGRFPFKAVVDELRNGKPFYELVNYFSILGGGVRDVIITGSTENIDIPGTELSFDSQIQVTGASVQQDEVQLTIAASEVAGSYITTDVKKLTSDQSMNLNVMQKTPIHIVSVLKRQSEFSSRANGADRLSASIKPFMAGEKQKLLPLIENPTIDSQKLVINFPALPDAKGLFTIASTAVISDLIETQNGNTSITSTVKRWEIYGLGWAKKMDLPKWPLGSTSTRKRVEINYIGSATKKITQLDDSLIEAATHVTHSSTDF